MSELTAVEELIEREVRELEERIERMDKDLPKATREHDRAAKAADKVWDRVIPRYDQVTDAPVKVQEALERATRVEAAALRTVFRLIDGAHAARAKIERLRHPAELERRSQTRERVNALRKEYGMADKAKKVTARDQGVPEDYLGENGNFKPGLDARYKSDLVLSIVGATDGDAKKMLQTFPEADARKRLEQRGWTSFLDRKLAIVAEKATKAEEKKAAQAAKIANKKATGSKAKAKAPAAEGEVTPDPKPEPKAKSRGRKVAA